MDTPVPIPNTEVKHFNGENSVSEDSKLLIFFALKHLFKFIDVFYVVANFFLGFFKGEKVV